MCFKVMATTYTADFRETDIREFIDIVSKNLHKTILIDPSVKGLISTRSYGQLGQEQYYQFFISVLDLYGFSVIPMDNGMLKVIPSALAKTSGAPVVGNRQSAKGDEIITRVIVLQNVPVRELGPLLSQLNDAGGIGSIAPYEPSNSLLMTGKASVINRLVDIVSRVDNDGQQKQDIIALEYASAAELAEMVKKLGVAGGQKGFEVAAQSVKVVADTRTNSLIISGTPKAREQARALISRLDTASVGPERTRVFNLKYAKAANLVGILTGSSQIKSMLESANNSESPNGVSESMSGSVSPGLADMDFKAVADEQTNAIVISAPPGVMNNLEKIIAQLDVARAQILVEAIIVEVQDGDGMNLGIQWGNRKVGGQQFTGTGLPGFSASADFSSLGENGQVSAETSLGKLNGVAMGFFRGDWSALVTALSSNTKNDILSTPSIVTLDNKKAAMNVGQDVPVLSGSQTTAADNIFNQIERKTVGTKLTVTPQISADNSVYMDIEQEVSSVDNTTGTNSALGPTFNTRTITNAVQVKSGETVVLGGLMDNASKEMESKVPLLGDIPLIGNLFRYKSVDSAKRNLMVFIKPTIIRDEGGYRSVSKSRYADIEHAQYERRQAARFDPVSAEKPQLEQFRSPGELPDARALLESALHE